MKRIIVAQIILVLTSVFVFKISYADNAEVLPKGVSRIGVKSKIYIPIEERFNQDSDIEDVDENYNANLNKSVFSALGDVETAFGMAPATATVGRSIISQVYF